MWVLCNTVSWGSPRTHWKYFLCDQCARCLLVPFCQTLGAHSVFFCHMKLGTPTIKAASARSGVITHRIVNGRVQFYELESRLKGSDFPLSYIGRDVSPDPPWQLHTWYEPTPQCLLWDFLFTENHRQCFSFFFTSFWADFTSHPENQSNKNYLLSCQVAGLLGLLGSQ